MKSITEIPGDSQMLLDISYDIQEVFEDYLTHMHRSFLAMLTVYQRIHARIYGRNSDNSTAQVHHTTTLFPSYTDS